MKISVFVKEPGKKLRHVNIENSLENLQRTVGGYIEQLRIRSDVVMLINEEARIKNLPRNFCDPVYGNLFGTVVFCGIKSGEDGDEWTDIPMTWYEAKGIFGKLMEE